jgi:hypothetical protein
VLDLRVLHLTIWVFLLFTSSPTSSLLLAHAALAAHVSTEQNKNDPKKDLVTNSSISSTNTTLKPANASVVINECTSLGCEDGMCFRISDTSIGAGQLEVSNRVLNALIQSQYSESELSGLIQDSCCRRRSGLAM